jgi:hypothetical protein
LDGPCTSIGRGADSDERQDLDDWRFYHEPYGLSSVYDLNLDGLTNTADRAIIEQNLGLDCRTD